MLEGATALHPMHKLGGGFFAKPRPFLRGRVRHHRRGTGLVHMAPTMARTTSCCARHTASTGLRGAGRRHLSPDWAWLGGQGSVINKKFVSADGPICSDLREVGALLSASDDFRHSYPHSWRSKAKVIFRATPQWFIPMDRADTTLIPDMAMANVDPISGVTPLLTVPLGNGATLRQTALDAIERTRWVPERSRNRIRSMVEGRPDWVISRQRAWGVPIALYVNRQTGEYLADKAVNARILDAFRAGGADAWFTADHQALLGADYDLADFEPVNDILDVWFDSGSTHAFVIEARYGEGTRATCIWKGRTSIAAGSSRRCSNPAARAAARRTTRC